MIGRAPPRQGRADKGAQGEELEPRTKTLEERVIGAKAQGELEKAQAKGETLDPSPEERTKLQRGRPAGSGPRVQATPPNS